MAIISSLNVLLGMDTAAFAAGAKKSRQQIGQLQASVITLSSAINVAQAGWATASGVLNSFADSAEKIDAVAKLADSTGFDTESIVALQHGAQLAGMEVGQLNDALQKMNVVLGRSIGGGGASKTLDELGLSAANLAKTRPEAALGQIADAINALPTPAEKAAAAVELFGKSGADLLPFLSGGSAGLAKMRQEADELGLTLSRLDAAQIEAANDAVTNLVASFGALKQQVLLLIGPTVIAELQGLFKSLHAFSEGDILGGLNILGNIADAKERLDRAAEDTFYQAQAARAAAAENQKLAESFDEVGAAATSNISAAASKFDELMKSIKTDQRLVGLNGVDREISKLAATGGAGRGGLANLKAEAQKLKDMERENELQQHANKLIDEAIPAQQKFDDLAAELETLYQARRLNAEQFFALYDEAAARLAEETKQPEQELAAPHEGPFDNRPLAGDALLRGTAEAFSASFSQKPVDKTLGELKDLSREQRDLLRKLADNKPAVATL